MPVPRLHAVAVIYIDHISVSALPAGGRNRAAVRRHYRRTHGAGDVDALVIGARACLRPRPCAEPRGDIAAGDRPDIRRRRLRAALHNLRHRSHSHLFLHDLAAFLLIVLIGDIGDDAPMASRRLLHHLGLRRVPAVVVDVNRVLVIILFVILLLRIPNRKLRLRHRDGDEISHPDHRILIGIVRVHREQIIH